MPQQPQHVDVSAYLTIEPKWATGRYNVDDKDRPILEGGRIAGVTQNRPSGHRKTGAIVTRVTFRIDAEAFLPLQPEAVIHIGAGDVGLIEVTADAPEENEE